MKKISVFNKIIAVVAILALAVSAVSLVLILRTNNYIDTYLLPWVAKDSGKTNVLIECVKGNKNFCDTLE